MKKLILIMGLVLVGALLFGCTAQNNLSEIIGQSEVVQTFLAENPDAVMTTTLLTKTIIENDSDFINYCGGVEAKEYYKIVLQENENRAVAFVDNNTVVCTHSNTIPNQQTPNPADVDEGTIQISEGNLLVYDDSPLQEQRTIPLVISVSGGMNDVEIGGILFKVYIETNENTARAWKKPISTIPDPWTNPVGNKGEDYIDIKFNKDINNQTKAEFIVNEDWSSGPIKYYVGGDKTTGQYWLFLAPQQFNSPNSTSEFKETFLDIVNTVGYYLPDTSTFNVLTNEGFRRIPNEGDLYPFVAKFWQTKDGNTNKFFVNTITGEIQSKLGLRPFADDKIVFYDSKGVKKEIPLTIQLMSYENIFQIGNTSFFISINPSLKKARYWRNSTSNVTDPWEMPTGDYYDVAYKDKNITSDTLNFNATAEGYGLINYYLVANDSMGIYYLVFKADEINIGENNIVGLDWTHVYSNYLANYYLPDTGDVSFLTNAGLPKSPQSGDNYPFTAKFHYNDGDEHIFYINTETSEPTNAPDTSCIESWNCGEWGDCSDGARTRTCIDSSNCGTTNNKPAETQSCTVACTEDWSCTAWTTCTNNAQSRTCTDLTDCGTDTNKPVLTQTCASEFDLQSCKTTGWTNGNTYTLKNSVSSGTLPVCFQLDGVQNITIDCQGKTISNGNALQSSKGIHVMNSNNIALKNCKINGFTGNGVYLSQSTWVNLFDNNITSNNTHGIYVTDSNYVSLIRNSTSSNGNAGIYLNFSYYTTLTSNYSNGNKYGFYEYMDNVSFQNYRTEFSANEFGCTTPNTTKDFYGCSSTDLGSSKISDTSTCVHTVSLENCQGSASFATFGTNNIFVKDTSGTQREVPFTISLSYGMNDFEVAGELFQLEIFDNNNTARYYDGSTWKTLSYYDNNVTTTATLTFWPNVSWEGLDYYLASNEMTGQWFLLLKNQKIKGFGWNGTSPYIELKGTNVPDLTGKLGYYLPDTSTYNLLTNLNLPHAPSEGDPYTFTSDWEIDYFGAKEYPVVDNRYGTKQ